MGTKKFTYPFCYVPSKDVREAAGSLIARIKASGELDSMFREGKMMGVLLTEAGPLYAFSGLAGGRSHVDGFVPPIFDTAAPGSYFKLREAEISAMPEGEERKAASAGLQTWLFGQYRVCNARGEWASIGEIFARRGLIPPGGTGDCAAPKLLQYAYNQGLKPLAMGEFWYGASHRSEVREEGRFYPSCMGKCGPLLSFMMEGLEVDDNPLDLKYSGASPEILHVDEDIIVVDKPAGLLSVPGRTKADSLLEHLQKQFEEVHSCHRLDKDTSGVMVFARSMSAKTAMELQFADKQVQKTYRARLCAADSPFRHARRGTIALPLMLDYYDRPRQMVDREHGKLAVTEYEIVEILPNGEIEVLFRPKTGRTHQLRVHSAHPEGLGRPIKGDRLYGSPSEDRLYLHAESLTFRHPGNNKTITFTSRSI